MEVDLLFNESIEMSGQLFMLPAIHSSFLFFFSLCYVVGIRQDRDVKINTVSWVDWLFTESIEISDPLFMLPAIHSSFLFLIVLGCRDSV